MLRAAQRGEVGSRALTMVCHGGEKKAKEKERAQCRDSGRPALPLFRCVTLSRSPSLSALQISPVF